MKKKYTINILAIVSLAVVALSSCSRDEVTPQQRSQSSSELLNITMEFEDFGADEKVGSRAAKDEKAFCETIDLGGNIEAEVRIEPDRTPATPATRANLSNGHYTIVAYQGNNVKGEMKGTWDGTTFVPDAAPYDKMFLDPGTYTFACFNDKITHNGTTLTINRGGMSVGAVLGINKNVAVSGKEQSLKFNMKNMQARVQIRLYTYRQVGAAQLHSGIQTTLSSVNNTDIPATAEYNVLTETWGTTTSAGMNESDVNNTLSSADYHYFLPNTDGSKLKLAFNSGQVYGRSVANGVIGRIVATPFNMQANKSYTVSIALHYKFTYLFSDGTTGLLAANPGKTPVGLVVNGPSRTAVALKDASSLAVWTTRSGQQNANMLTSPNDTSNPLYYDGYNETWQASNSLDGTTVKGTSTDFPAFKAAADYSPGVSTAPNIGKWYLPAIGEMYKYMMDSLSIGNTVMWKDTYNWAFTRAGGDGIHIVYEYDYSSSFPTYSNRPVNPTNYRESYYSSSELDAQKFTSFVLEDYTWYNYLWPGNDTYFSFFGAFENDNNDGARVRAFVHY